MVDDILLDNGSSDRMALNIPGLQSSRYLVADIAIQKKKIQNCKNRIYSGNQKHEKINSGKLNTMEDEVKWVQI